FCLSFFQAIFLKRLSANNFATFFCLSLFIRTFVTAEKGMLRSALNRLTPCRGISLKRQQEQLLNKKTM
ncbi:MAG: hypothetical protein U0M48_05550, partial [Xylanibacter rarus]